MKQFIILLLALVTAATHSQEEKNETMRSTRTVSTSHHTSVSGWEWKSGSWWYDNKPSEAAPFSYSITEEITEKYWQNGVETKRRYRVTQEITVEYASSLPEWRWIWRDGCWYHHGKKVNVLPPSYECIKKEVKKTVDLDYDTGEEL